ncbi:hypothetical protein L204_100005 [Cryptococcus depauperatus]
MALPSTPPTAKEPSTGKAGHIGPTRVIQVKVEWIASPRATIPASTAFCSSTRHHSTWLWLFSYVNPIVKAIITSCHDNNNN